MQSLSAFFATKRGLAGALHSGEPAYTSLPGHFEARLRPALQNLLASAIFAGRIRSDIAAGELQSAIARLSMSEVDGPAQAQRMVALLADGLAETRVARAEFSKRLFCNALNFPEHQPSLESQKPHRQLFSVTALNLPDRIRPQTALRWISAAWPSLIWKSRSNLQRDRHARPLPAGVEAMSFAARGGSFAHAAQYQVSLHQPLSLVWGASGKRPRSFGRTMWWPRSPPDPPV
jgi:hypothetical protein